MVVHDTVLEVCCKKLESNFRFLKSKAGSKTKIIAVVKAYAYGHGDVMIAKELAEKVYAFWVADFEEGISLRNSAIKNKIIVANPGSNSINKIISKKLDVVIHNFFLLKIFCDLKKNINVHIKLNTGMNRYGFKSNELPELVAQIKKNKHLKILTICSHLSASQEKKEDIFTKNQIKKFDELSSNFIELYGKKIDRHILNTSGLLRFTPNKYEAVRIGIGLYGGIKNKHLDQVATLKSKVVQTISVKKGGSVGYNRLLKVKKNMKIAIIPFGYADGLSRKYGNQNIKFIIGDQFFPVVGEISMDSCALDITNTNISIGDTVILFGPKNTIVDLAKNMNTIPHEIYATLNRRIKRIYTGSLD